MAGSFDAVTNRYLEISGSGAPMEYPSTGWTISSFFYPDSGLPINAFAYLHNHREPLINVHAVNMMVQASDSKVRLIVDVPAGTVVDFTSTNTIVANSWNAIAVSYDGSGNVKLWLNGTKTATVVAPFGLVTPSGTAFIGHAAHGGSRQFNGRICHPAKWSRALTEDEGSRYSAQFISPQFAQNSANWHLEMFKGGTLAFDLTGFTTVTENLMAYGEHAPVDFPAAQYELIDREPSEGQSMLGPQWSGA